MSIGFKIVGAVVDEDIAAAFTEKCKPLNAADVIEAFIKGRGERRY